MFGKHIIKFKQFVFTGLMLVLYCLLSVNSFAQNCKYSKNEIDPFTKKLTKETKPSKIMGSFYTAGTLRFSKVDTTITLIFDYAISSYSDFEPYTISEGAKLIFLMENDEMITLNSINNISGERSVIFGLVPVYSCYLKKVKYQVNQKVLDQFLSSNLKTIRFYRNEANGNEDYIDAEVKNKHKNVLPNLVKCIM